MAWLCELLSGCVVCVQMGYGSRAMELLQQYYEGKMASIDDAESDTAEVRFTLWFVCVCVCVCVCESMLVVHVWWGVGGMCVCVCAHACGACVVGCGGHVCVCVRMLVVHVWDWERVCVCLRGVCVCVCVCVCAYACGACVGLGGMCMYVSVSVHTCLRCMCGLGVCVRVFWFVCVCECVGLVHVVCMCLWHACVSACGMSVCWWRVRGILCVY